MKKYRNEYFDFLRGIAIIMVIGIHTFPTLTEYDSIGSMLTIIVRQLLNCAVPLFLAISGYFIAKKDLSTATSRIHFWSKQIPAVYIPCIVFSLGWFAMDLSTCGTSNILTKLIILAICGYSIYYFIALIIQLYIITPWLLRINNKGGGDSLRNIVRNLNISDNIYAANRGENSSTNCICRPVRIMDYILYDWNMVLHTFKKLLSLAGMDCDCHRLRFICY